MTFLVVFVSGGPENGTSVTVQGGMVTDGKVKGKGKGMGVGVGVGCGGRCGLGEGRIRDVRENRNARRIRVAAEGNRV